MLRGARHRPHHEELVEGEVAVVPVTAADSKFLLDISGVSSSTPTTLRDSPGA